MANDSNVLKTKLRGLPVIEGPFPEVDFDVFPRTPQDAFTTWLDETITAGVKEPHAMTVSTVDDQGYPDARVLILKNVDARGWHFAVKADSPKAQQIAANDRVALTFYWPLVGRQTRIRGKATQLPQQECIQDFSERPLKSQVSAIASKQSQVLSNPEELGRRLAEVESSIADERPDVLLKWKVYAVSPDRVEFWQASNDRLHKRLQYTANNDGSEWVKNLLWP